MMRLLYGIVSWTLALFFFAEKSAGFAPEIRTTIVRPIPTTILNVAVPPNLDGELDSNSYILSKEELNPLMTFGEGDKEKIVNPFGLWCLFISLVTGPVWMLAMKLVHKMEDDKNRALYDMTGKIWSKAWLSMINSYPSVSGNLDRLDASKDQGACLYVANHASWLDIPVLCTALDPVFKFIAKGELAQVPCIGTQLSGVSDLSALKFEGDWVCLIFFSSNNDV